MNYVVSVVAGICLLLALILIITAHSKSKSVYDEYLEPLDSKAFPAKKYMGIGLYLMDKYPISNKIPDSFKQNAQHYENNIRSKVGELYGAQYQDYYYQIHVANKWIMGLIGYVFGSFISLMTSLQGDFGTGITFLVVAFAAAVGLPFLQDKSLDSKVEKRRTQIRIEFPDFINKLVLLVNAGMSIPKAWEKITDECEGNTPLQRELQVCMVEVRAGKSIEIAYEEFGRRCRIKEIIKFVSVIILNLRKGGNELVLTLQSQSNECWDMRKSAAKRLGEEASSKMMLPMAIMLVGIMMIVALPAVLSIMSM